jgi:Flp pilus assembly protein TadG
MRLHRPKRTSRLGLAADTRGAAAVEFALIAGMLIIGLFNTIDLARYLYTSMEVSNATQMAAQSVWQTCDVAHLPASTKCSGWSTAATTAAQSTSLGTAVTLATGSPSEGYYCVNGSGALVRVSDVNSAPSDCSGVGNATAKPADYVAVSTSYTYTPLFPALNVSGTLPTPITDSTLMRMQ